MELADKIGKLKKERQAVILAHNYQRPEVQDIADYTGDSLGLSLQAAQTDAKIIIFCGVHFMAETAKILSPDKTVLMPDIHAGCPMADMITAEALKKLKAQHPQALVVSYVNTPAEVKAESDYCCTSANAVKVVNAVPLDKEIIFTPDQYLGNYVEKQTGRKLILWPGYCNVHTRIMPEDVAKAKKAHPKAVVMAHPECPPQVLALADEILSTGGMLKFAKGSTAQEFIVVTEVGIIHQLNKANPDKTFYPVAENIICPNMKLITLEKVLWSLEELKEAVIVPEDITKRAKKAIDRMLELA